MSHSPRRATAIPRGAFTAMLFGLMCVAQAGSSLRPSVEAAPAEEWSQTALPPGIAASAIKTLAAHPEQGDTVVFGTAQGVYRTDDAGQTWRQLAALPIYHTIVFAPSNPQRLYALSAEPARSDNGGLHWERVAPPPGVALCGIDVAPADADTIYAYNCATPTTLYTSADAGATWRTLSPIGGLLKLLLIWPGDNRILIAVTVDGAQRSADGGQSWTSINAGNRALTTAAVEPRPPYTLYLAHTHGVLRSIDGGVNWQDSRSERQAQAMIASPFVPDEILAADSESMWRLAAHDSWWSAATWGSFADVTQLARSWNDSHIVYALRPTGLWRYISPSPADRFSNRRFLPMTMHGPFTGGSAAQQALDQLNLYRATAGVGQLRLHPNIVKAAENHAYYHLLHMNDPSAWGRTKHEEVAGKQGFTGVTASDRLNAAGFRWASGPEVMYYLGDPRRSVDGWMSTIFHRTLLLDPETRYAGYGTNADRTTDVMNFGKGPIERGTWADARPYPLAYPAQSQTNVPTSWRVNESPDPLPPNVSRLVGYPFTLQGVAGKLDVVLAELLDSANAPVAVHPNPPDCEGYNCYSLIPIKPLAPYATYTAHLRGSVAGVAFEQRWRFTTGASTSLSSSADALTLPPPGD